MGVTEPGAVGDDGGPRPRTLRERLVQGTFWTLLGSAFVQGMGLLAGIIVARVIGRDAFGQYGIVQSTLGTFGVFAGMAMGITTSKHVAEFRDTDPARAGRFLGLTLLVGSITSTLVMLGVFLAAGVIARDVLAAPALTGLLRIGVLLLVFNALHQIQMAGLAGLEAFRQMAVANFLAGLGLLPCVGLGVWFFGLPGAVGGLAAARLVTVIVFRILLLRASRRQNIVISYRGLRAEWSTLWTFSLPAFLGGVMVGPANWLCNVMLVRQEDGMAEMGLLNATLQWQAAVQFVPTLVANVTLPMLSNLYGRGQYRPYFRLLLVAVAGVFVVGALVAAPIIILARHIMAWYGAEFVGGADVLRVMMLGVVLLVTTRILSQVTHSRGKAWVDFGFCSAASVARLLLTWWLISRGALGWTWAFGVAYALHALGLTGYAAVVRRRQLVAHDTPPTTAEAASLPGGD